MFVYVLYNTLNSFIICVCFYLPHFHSLFPFELKFFFHLNWYSCCLHSILVFFYWLKSSLELAFSLLRMAVHLFHLNNSHRSICLPARCDAVWDERGYNPFPPNVCSIRSFLVRSYLKCSYVRFSKSKIRNHAFTFFNTCFYFYQVSRNTCLTG